MAKNGTKNGQKRVEAEQSSYYREYPVAFGQKREIMGVGQSDTANNTLCRYFFRYIRFWPKKHRVLPFLAIALFFSFEQVGEFDPPIAHTKGHTKGPVDRETLVVQSSTPSVTLQDCKSILSDCLHNYHRKQRWSPQSTLRAL